MAIIPIFIPHAGCPHQCVFCNQKAISGQQIASATAVTEQIERYLQWVKPNKANEAAFYGGSFTGLPLNLQAELFAPVDKLWQLGVIGGVRLSTRPDYIDQERIELLQQHHVQTVELGVQSLDNAVLKLAERGHDSEIVVQAVRLLKENGFSVGIQLMIGMPGQSFSSLQATVQQCIALKPDIARLYPLLVIKNTPLEVSYRQGDFTPLPLQEAVQQSAWAYRALTQAGIKVIRVGLQADTELCSAGNIVAGPFHPAFGELVQSYLYYEELTPQIQALLQQQPQEIWINTPLQEESKVRGLRNANLKSWQALANPSRIKIKVIADAKVVSVKINNIK